jgi:hypothetical protein
MASKKSVVKEPLTAEDIRHALELTRRLVVMSCDQIRQAKLDLDLAKTGLAELEEDLKTRGVAAG